MHLITHLQSCHRFLCGKIYTSRLLFIALGAVLLLVVSCAKMGNPDGGWFDEQPPKIIGTLPQDGSVNAHSRKIRIRFNEYIKIENATEKVVISPPQLEMPEIKGQGKDISIELKDSLKPNTTYTIDFSDAITDNNEGNPLGNYTYSFATGSVIDTLEVSGYVLEAENMEPVKGILVGLYDDKADSAFLKKPMLRVSRTDSRGRFVIKGIAAGKYRIFALQDADGNYLFNQKSEKLAFNHDTIAPSIQSDIRQDTIWVDSLHIKDIHRVGYTRFLPDDIVLRAFTEVQTDRYLLKTDRPEADRFTLYFSYGNEQLPIIRGLNFCEKDAFLLESSPKKDTLTYWLRDTLLVKQDTLRFEMQYLSTDTTGLLTHKTDTLELLAKTPYAKRVKQQADEYEKWKKEKEKATKQGEKYNTVMKGEMLEPKYDISSQTDPDKPLYIEFPRPLRLADSTKIHLYSKIDTLWYRAPFVFRQEKDAGIRYYKLMGEWRPGVEYSLEIDSAAFSDIYGKTNGAFKQGFKVKDLKEYATLFVHIKGTQDSSIIAELLDASDKVVMRVVAQNGTAKFFFVNPGTYYLRAFADRNGNGSWDTGNYAANLQPEPVYYFHDKLECKANRDMTKEWNFTALPLYRQKPSAITKQKPDTEKKIKQQNKKRAQELGITYIPQS